MLDGFDDWQRDFVACAMAVREGWAVMGYSMYLKRYVNTIIDGHSDHLLLGLFPIIAVDMQTHAYFRDYMADRTSYVVAMMRELNWNVIEERVERAEKIAEALK